MLKLGYSIKSQILATLVHPSTYNDPVSMFNLKYYLIPGIAENVHDKAEMGGTYSPGFTQ